MDFGNIAKKAQDALHDGTAEKLVRDNADKIETVLDKAADFAEQKMPARAEQIEAAVAKAKDVLPGGHDGAGKVQHAVASPTPEVDRVADAQG